MRAILTFTVVGAMLGGCLSSAYEPGNGGGGSGDTSGGGSGGTSGGGSGGSGGGAVSSGNVTFYRDVLPVFQKDCLSCHATGGAAQPALDNAASATAAASTIEAAIQ